MPKDLIESPKRGFSIPIDSWLNGPLKEWTLDMLSPEKIKKDGIFNSQSIANIIKNTEAMKSNSSSELWNILMFQAWYEKWN